MGAIEVVPVAALQLFFRRNVISGVIYGFDTFVSFVVMSWLFLHRSLLSLPLFIRCLLFA